MIIDHWLSNNILFTQYLGNVGGDALIDHALEKSGDERFDSLMYIVGDWTQVQQTHISTNHVEALVACLRNTSKLCPTAKNASVVPRNNTGLGLGAWYRHIGESITWEIDVFGDLQEAAAYYNLPFSLFKSAIQQQK